MSLTTARARSTNAAAAAGSRKANGGVQRRMRSPQHTRLSPPAATSLLVRLPTIGNNNNNNNNNGTALPGSCRDKDAEHKDLFLWSNTLPVVAGSPCPLMSSSTGGAPRRDAHDNNNTNSNPGSSAYFPLTLTSMTIPCSWISPRPSPDNLTTTPPPAATEPNNPFSSPFQPALKECFGDVVSDGTTTTMKPCRPRERTSAAKTPDYSAPAISCMAEPPPTTYPLDIDAGNIEYTHSELVDVKLYLRSCGATHLFKGLMKDLTDDKPADPVSYMLSWLELRQTEMENE